MCFGRYKGVMNDHGLRGSWPFIISTCNSKIEKWTYYRRNEEGIKALAEYIEKGL